MKDLEESTLIKKAEHLVLAEIQGVWKSSRLA